MRKIFQSLPWIHPALPGPLVEIYRKHGVPMTIRRNQPLKRSGEAPKSFLLVKGLCVYQVPDLLDGAPSILSLITPGRSICDISALINARVNVETVAWQDCEVLAVPPGTLAEAAARDPAVSALLIHDLVTKQESHIEGMVANFSLSPQIRLKTLFRVLLTAYGIQPRNGRMVLPLLLNNSQYGKILNLSRISVSRILSQWQREGLLEKDRRTIAVRQALFEDLNDWIDGTGDSRHTCLEAYRRPVLP